MTSSLDDPLPRGNSRDPRRLPQSVGSYRVSRELGQGATGVVYAARREGSAGEVALKVLRPGPSHADLVRRFRREAAFLENLRHPGIAAFLDAGEADLVRDGLRVRVPFLAMELVRGLPLRRYARERELEHRARVELLARVCDAVDHAHSRGIVHRDLTPANILVCPSRSGDVGQPKVLDFGLSLAKGDEASGERVTRTGALVGTLPYMSPEQVAARAPLDPRSDVHALGVLLFELLTDRLPFDVRGRAVAQAARTIETTEAVRLSRYSPHLKGDLELVVRQCLEKEAARRYPTAGELAADLRAWLAGRPVRARAPGPLRRAHKWIRRHPLACASSTLAASSLFAVSLFLVDARGAYALARGRATEANASAADARERQADVARQRRELLGLSDAKKLDGLLRRAERLWPVHPDRVPALDEWLQQAGELEARTEPHRAFLARLLAEPTADASAEGARERAWWIESLGTLVAGLESFADPRTGTLAAVEARRASAATLRRRSLEDHADLWRAACEAVAASPHYGGLRLEPQLGLVPLGEDESSGLWEFWELVSGERPERDPDSGRLAIGPSSGIVLVLIPSGRFVMGAQAGEPNAQHFDAEAYEHEGPVRHVALSAFFLGKHELTRGQWLRLAGANCALPGNEGAGGDPELDPRHPVARVTWLDCHRILARAGLRLPSEAQWEYAARAGTDSIWYTGDDPASLEGAANLKDRAYERTEGLRFTGERIEPWDDGFSGLAPAGRFGANAYGLHDVHGNAWEWCLDVYGSDPPAGPFAVDPCLDCDFQEGDVRLRVRRGGEYAHDARWARVTLREAYAPTFESPETGVRAARSLER